MHALSLWGVGTLLNPQLGYRSCSDVRSCFARIVPTFNTRYLVAFLLLSRDKFSVLLSKDSISNIDYLRALVSPCPGVLTRRTHYPGILYIQHSGHFAFPFNLRFLHSASKLVATKLASHLTYTPTVFLGAPRPVRRYIVFLEYGAVGQRIKPRSPVYRLQVHGKTAHRKLTIQHKTTGKNTHTQNKTSDKDKC